MDELLSVRDLHAFYGTRRSGLIEAVAGVDLTIPGGTIMAVVGESGCGKSTLASAIVGLHRHRTGTVTFEGQEVSPIGLGRRSEHERRLQMICQNPHGTFNPRRQIGQQIASAIRLVEGRGAGSPTVVELLERAGVSADAITRYPHEFSGGQLQRLAIARALAARPSLIIADEPIAALDASAQVQITDLCAELARTDGLSVLLISHDLGVVRQISDYTAVMYLGRIVEGGPTRALWEKPEHPYTQALIAAIPYVSPEQRMPQMLAGEVPNPSNPPNGCRFHPRCPVATDRCSTEPPPSVTTAAGGSVLCWLPADKESQPPDPVSDSTDRVHAHRGEFGKQAMTIGPHTERPGARGAGQ